MNLDHRAADALIRALTAGLHADEHGGAEVAVLPPFTALATAQTSIQAGPTRLAYGAQDLSRHDSGAHTGEISGEMLRSLGCTYVLVGHSERRQHHGETDDLVNAKVQTALRHGLTPIICVGEELDVRELNGQIDHCNGQVSAALRDVTEQQVARVVIAYEPVWAIGTGRVATPQDAQEVCGEVRLTLSQLYSADVSDQIRVLYGGSVKASNAPELMTEPDVDGALVGGASLNADEFLGIVRAAASTAGPAQG